MTPRRSTPGWTPTAAASASPDLLRGLPAVAEVVGGLGVVTARPRAGLRSRGVVVGVVQASGPVAAAVGAVGDLVVVAAGLGDEPAAVVAAVGVAAVEDPGGSNVLRAFGHC